MTDELKLCPFCGGEGVLQDHRVGWCVQCVSCGATVTGMFRRDLDHCVDDEQSAHLCASIDWGAVKQTAAEAWNTRQPDPAVLVEALERIASRPGEGVEYIPDHGDEPNSEARNMELIARAALAQWKDKSHEQ